MEAGILALLFLFGGYVISTDDVEEKDIKIVKQQIEDNNNFQNKNQNLDFKIEEHSNQRFFKNIYQLEIKQHHFEGNIRITDSYSTMSISSADLMKLEDVYQDYDENNNPYDVFFKFTTQFIPNDKETKFDMKYRINYKEDYSVNKRNNSIFEIDIENKMDMYVNKKILIEHKNYQYELELKKNDSSKYFKNAEIMDCNGDFTCEILKENTIYFKKNLENNRKETKVEPKNQQTRKVQKTDVLKKVKLIDKKDQLKTFNNYIIHKVEKGESLSNLSRKYDVPVMLINKLNNLTTTKLQIGQKIVIANKTTMLHKINEGENLFKISSKYNKKMKNIMELNNLNDPSKIYEGYVLILSL